MGITRVGGRRRSGWAFLGFLADRIGFSGFSVLLSHYSFAAKKTFYIAI
jgi:hypothetical protein